MLYISSVVENNRYDVTDTDDGTIESVSAKDLAYICTHLGVEVSGVAVDRGCIVSINVYNPEDALSTERTKLRVFKGVDIRVFGDEITSITVDKSLTKFNDPVRLSDYGTKLGVGIFRDMISSFAGMYDKYLTVKLDDKLKISNGALDKAFEHGVVLDLYDVTSDDVLDMVIKELLRMGKRAFNWLSFGFVVASDSTLDYLKAAMIINNVLGSDDNINGTEFTHIKQLVKDVKGVTAHITRRYVQEFKTLATMQYTVTTTTHSDLAEAIKRYAFQVMRLNWGSVLFQEYNRPFCFGMFTFMINYSCCNTKGLERFRNYMKFFDATDEVKEYYVLFLKRVVKWIEALAVERHFDKEIRERIEKEKG